MLRRTSRVISSHQNKEHTYIYAITKIYWKEFNSQIIIKRTFFWKETHKVFLRYANSIYSSCVALQWSRKYSTSCQTLCKSKFSVFAPTVLIRSFTSFKVTEKPHLSQHSSWRVEGVRSGHQGGQEVDILGATHTIAKQLPIQEHTALLMCGGNVMLKNIRLVFKKQRH